MGMAALVREHCENHQYSYSLFLTKKVTYFAKRSQVSAISPTTCIMGLILVHIACSIGCLVLSCFTVGLAPCADCLAAAASEAMFVGSGTDSLMGSEFGSPGSCLPTALLRAMEPIPETKL